MQQIMYTVEILWIYWILGIASTLNFAYNEFVKNEQPDTTNR